MRKTEMKHHAKKSEKHTPTSTSSSAASTLAGVRALGSAEVGSSR